MSLNLDRLIFDPSDAANSPNVGAYITADDGTLIGHTGGALDVNITNSLSISLDGVYSGGNTDPDNVGLISHARAASPADTDQTIRVTAGAVSADDVVAANVFALDTAGYMFGFDGSAWDRITATGGAMDINFATQDADITVDIATNLVADDAADAGGSLKAGSVALDGALSAISASGDRADLTSDMYRRVYINDAPNVSADINAVSVATTEVSLSATPLAGRTRIIVQNSGSNSIFVGPTGVLISTGIEVSKGGTLSLELGEDVELFGICASGTQDTRVLELA